MPETSSSPAFGDGCPELSIYPPPRTCSEAPTMLRLACFAALGVAHDVVVVEVLVHRAARHCAVQRAG